MQTMNMLERHKKELKRRTREVGIFPSMWSCIRLIGSMALETNKDKNNESIACSTLEYIFVDGLGASENMSPSDIEREYWTTFDGIDDPYHPKLSQVIADSTNNTAPGQIQDK